MLFLKGQKTFNLEINDAEKLQTIMAAAENNDKLWPVLRFHLAVELLLTFYINEKHIGEITKYAKLPRDLGGNFFCSCI